MYREGKAAVYGNGAFVNSAARLTRDIGTAIASRLCKGGYSVLDATAATGLRGMRYLMEGNAGSCTFLEINRTAYTALKRNLSRNKIKADALNTSIQEFANSYEGRFDVVDLDPFGGVQPYVYDLMKVLGGGSLFFATATDTAVLCGAHSNACVRLYGSVPMHNEMCKEAGMRILVGSIARTAATFDLGIEPLLSITYLHYMRVHVRLRHGSKAAMAAMDSLGYIEYCNRCGRRGCQAGLIPKRLLCECGARLQLGGPLWVGSMRDRDLTTEVCSGISAGGTGTEERNMLDRLVGELDTPLLYDIPSLTKRLGIASASPYRVIGTLAGEGRAASQVHYDPSCIKTDADFEDVISAIRRASKASV